MIQNLESIRKGKNKTQEEIANYIGVTRQTYSKIEKWEVEATLWQAVKLAELLWKKLEEFFPKDVGVIKTKETDWEKYKQIIRLFIENWTTKKFKITKTKLAKLCYLADFAWYYYNLEPLTGLQYKRLPQWPVPDAFFRAIDELFEEESISIQIDGNSHLISNKWYVAGDRLTLEEKSFLNKIAKKWQRASTSEIVDFTHQQIPWMICKEKEIIPYNLITQEESTNVF